MEFRTLLIIPFFLFTVSVSNPVSSATQSTLAALPQSSSGQCVGTGQSCVVQNDVCCSGYCRHEAMNSYMGTCTSLQSPIDLTSRENAATEACLPNKYKNCKKDKDCCSGHCWGSRLGGSFCSTPTVATEVNAREDAVEDITQETCAANGESCSGNDGDCCSDFCWCTIWNPFACTCAVRDAASADTWDIRDVSVDLSCGINNSKCADNQDCCSRLCRAGRCEKDETRATITNLDHRVVSNTQADEFGDQEASYHVDLVPPPPCKLGGVTCQIDRECCYGKCDRSSKTCWQPRVTLP